VRKEPDKSGYYEPLLVCWPEEVGERGNDSCFSLRSLGHANDSRAPPSCGWHGFAAVLFRLAILRVCGTAIIFSSLILPDHDTISR
jgi:hypothetical protein